MHSDNFCAVPRGSRARRNQSRLSIKGGPAFLFLHHPRCHIFKRDKLFHMFQLLPGDGHFSTRSLHKLQKSDAYYTIKVAGAFLSHLKSEQCVCI